MRRILLVLTGSILGTLVGAVGGFIGGAGLAIWLSVGGVAEEFAVGSYAALGMGWLVGIAGGAAGAWLGRTDGRLA